MNQTGVVCPPCEISLVIRFVEGKCPYSGETDCRDCISNEFDAECVRFLCDTDSFGHA
jgi:hypothetical protein